MSAARRDVEELGALLRRCGLIKNSEGLYARPAGASATSHYHARARALAHELDTLVAVVNRLEKATRPPAPAYLKLPAEGTMARALLEVLHRNVQGHDHAELRSLVGLTDAELAARIMGGRERLNSARPRRLDLQRAGWVEVAGQTGTATRWTLTADGRRAMAGLEAGLVTHLMANSLLDACGTAPAGSLSVTPVRDHVTCLACLRLPQPAEEVAAGE